MRIRGGAGEDSEEEEEERLDREGAILIGRHQKIRQTSMTHGASLSVTPRAT